MSIPGRIQCPCCRSEYTYRLHCVDASSAAHALSSSKDPGVINRIEKIIKDLWNGSSAEWIRCTECGSDFAWPFVPCTEEYYEVTYTGELFYPSWKWDYEITFNTIKKTGNIDDKLLEVGAGNGAFVSRVKDVLIRSENILCTEFSEYGKRTILQKGIQCISEDITSMNTPDYRKKFNIICIFQVLEHLHRLDEFFETLNCIADSNANLFITVPNHRHRDFYDSINEYPDWPPGHISRFTPSGIRALAERNGWNLVQHCYQPTGHKQQSLLFLDERFKKNRKLSSLVLGIANKPIRKLIFAFSLGILGLLHIPSLYRLNQRNMGISQWFWLKKFKVA